MVTRPFLDSCGSGAMTIDRQLGNAYLVVRQVQENLDAIITLAGIKTDITAVNAALIPVVKEEVDRWEQEHNVSEESGYASYIV